MTFNIVAIPSRDQPEMLSALIGQLVDHGNCDEIFVYDNTDDGSLDWCEDGDNHVRVMPCPGWPIYRMWNHALYAGADVARLERRFATVTILNDDIVIPPLFIQTLSDALFSDPKWWCVYPDYRLDESHWGVGDLKITRTEGTYRFGGMCGWAFMVRASVMGNPVPYIDEETFKWWCGDDEIEHLIRANGGAVGRVEGLGLKHYGSASAQLHPELHHIGWEDVVRFQAKYGRKP